MVRAGHDVLTESGRGDAPSFGRFANRRLGVGGGPSLLDSRRFERLRGGIVSDVFRIGSRPLMPVERRRFIVALAGGLLATPLAAEAQQAGKAYRVGLLLYSAACDRTFVMAPF